MSHALRILHVASEAVPFAKTGGLGDVAAALPKALRAARHDARLVIPGYRTALRSAEKQGLSWLPGDLTIEAGGIDHRLGIGVVEHDGLLTYLLACNELFDRDGIYGPGAGHDFEDNSRRFSVFSKASLALCGMLGWRPHVVHAHDWQAGLVPVLLERAFQDTLPATRSVFTIHNIAYQGAFPAHDLRLTGLDGSVFNPVQLDHWGRLNLLKAGIVFSDRLTTVSSRYADEIQTPEFAYGLDKVVRDHRFKLSGIVNGIDAHVWNPAHDPHLAAAFSTKKLAGKRACRAALAQECHLDDDPHALLLAVVSRLVEQKGIDLLLDVLPPFLADRRVQLVVLGSGELHLEHRLGQLQAAHPGRAFAWYGYNEPMAHRVIAGADAFAMPSRFEPCGLTQMYAKRYGTLPIVRYTGGLADTVTDVSTGAGDGFTFGPADAGHLASVLDRAAAMHRHDPTAWQRAQQRAMACDHSWERVAQDYAALYRRISLA